MKRFVVTLFIISSVLIGVLAKSACPIYGLIDRIDPGASSKFIIELKDDGTNYFEIDKKNGKVVIRGNTYPNIGVGLNWYLKYVAGVHLAWNRMEATLPAKLPLPAEKIRRTSDLEHVYDFNYCTYSYTMPFWDWDRWEREIDWMVLHGVNLPLAAVGTECVWRNMLLKLGYTPDEVGKFISGPAFMAWWEMNNLEGWGGPNPDSWYDRQEALQKQILARMKQFGIKPVFPGYAGMMPHDADKKLGLKLTITEKPWNGFVRPAFLQPTDSRYAEIAELYYREQQKLFGRADYFSMDPFHEVSNAEGVDFDAAGNAIMGAMKKYNPKAVWVLQGWDKNPRQEMIDNLKQGDLLILDLFAECRPMWGAPSISRREQGFKQHDWVFCLLENFGGNVGLHGRMDQLLENYNLTKTSPLARNMRGIGFSMEGSENNPVMFELMSELPWRDEPVDKYQWLADYAEARYGNDDPMLAEAWKVLSNSIYNCPRGNNQQGTHESIFCARPNLDNLQASSWSKMANYYDPADTEEAARMFVSAAPNYRGNNNFEYDLVDVVRQAISDKARQTYQYAIADYKAFNRKGFKKHSDEFLRLLLLQDSLLATRGEFRVGRWLNFAKKAGTTDAEKKLYEWNARVQITTWGARENADKGKLRDYAHKEWNGLLKDFYYNRWLAFFESLGNELNGRGKAEPIDYYAIEEPWTLDRNEYPAVGEGDCVDTAIAIFNEIFGQGKSDQALTRMVDTRVGTAPSITKAAGMFGKNTEELGQTLPAVLVPHGMNFWTAQTSDTEHKCVAPYYYEHKKMQGFRNSHWIVGGCTQDYGSATLMPLYGSLRCMPDERATAFSHSQETAAPDYYSVTLPEEGIDAEMTATSRAAIFRFKYDRAGKGYIVFQPNSDEGKGFVRVDTAANRLIAGNPVHRIYQGKGEPANFTGYTILEFDRRPAGWGTFCDDETMAGSTAIAEREDIGCYVEFDVAAGDIIVVKAASSFVSADKAVKNMLAEIPGWDFDEVRDNLTRVWEDHLGQIQVETPDERHKRKFYTAMYHASFLPHEVNDADGEYCAFSTGEPARLAIGQKAYYDDFSMWDTYRALHPLFNLLQPSMNGDMMQSMVEKSQQGGWLPIFPCWNSYTAAMIGDHCIAAIADAYCKGVRNFDIDAAYAAMRKNAFEMPAHDAYVSGKGRRALDTYMRHGYVPLEDTVPYAYHKREQVSRTLEYAYDDFALAQVAKALGKKDDYKKLAARAANYKNVINPATGYVCGRYADGKWADDDPFSFSKHITEGAPCHYTWYVPHDPQGLMQAMGGKEAYVQKLDSMFAEGRYWHGNEPCHQVAFMYNYAGLPAKTAEQVRNIINTEYLDHPGGLSGNDDAGQMSAWYVFASLGFYPVCPGTPYYMISAPTFNRCVIRLENSKTLTLNAPLASEQCKYIKSVTHDGKPYTLNYFVHDDLMQGGVWDFEMTDDPDSTWGADGILNLNL